MRLRLSIAVLVILACFLLEASATTSNRNTEAIKENSRSTNSKDVRYSKIKSGDYRKKESGEEQELGKRKKQRRDAHGNPKIKSNEVLKNNKNERGGKVSYEEQNRVKSNKHNKLDRKIENLKNGKNNVKSNTEKSKKSKRSVEMDQPEDLDIHRKEGAPDNVDSRYNSASKKMSKNTHHKKSESEGADCEAVEGHDVDNIELESTSHPSEVRKIKSSKKNKVKQEKQEVPVMTKAHKRSGKSDSMCKKNVVSRGTESEKKIQINEKSDVDGYSNDLSENGYHLNGETLMKGKKSKTENMKDINKSSKKSSTTGSKKKCRKYDKSAQLSSEEDLGPAERSENHESGSCDMETQCVSQQNKVHVEESKYFADDIVKSTIVNFDEQDIDDMSFENPSNTEEVDSEEDLYEADEDINEEENCSQENMVK